MAAPDVLFDFNLSRSKLSEYVYTAVDNVNLNELEAAFHKLDGSELEKKATLDQVFRDALSKYVAQDSDTAVYRNLIESAVTAVEQKLCSPYIPFTLLADLFDSITLQKCDDVFKLVEENVAVWKSEAFYDTGKNYLLRMCNDIVRRLSKSQNTVFCGRIQLFLATLFPLSEKSGLNLMSQFHLENVTVFNTKSDEVESGHSKPHPLEKELAMEEGEMEEQSGPVPINYNLYRKFWQLQDFFRRPVQCYEKVAWKTFVNYSDEVLRCFESVKLDDLMLSKKCLQGKGKEAAKDNYFAKFLTSENLLDLQLSDSNFRRYVLVQFLIVFQYLNAPVKFKTTTQVITDEQSAWVKDTTTKVYSVLRETPPDGTKFANDIEHALAREENWNEWKNMGCPSYVRHLAAPSATRTPGARAKRRSLGDDLKASGGKMVKMGSGELTRLWNICPDNMAACCRNDKNFLPSLEEYFEEAMEQADPGAMVEDQYKLVNNKSFAWKGLRLLACRSADFFTIQSPVTRMPLTKYLDTVMLKLAKTLPSHTNEDNPPDDAEAASVDGGDDDAAASGGTTEEQNSPTDGADEEEEEEEEGGQVVSAEELDAVAAKMGATWEQLATELNMSGKTEDGDDGEDDPARAMLTSWTERESERATVAALKFALSQIGQGGVATSVFGSDET